MLTTPLIRCLKKQLACELHYLCKHSFLPVLVNNPYIDKLWTFDKDINEIIAQLKEEQFDFVVDLHHNLRTARLKKLLGRPSASFPKINVEKWLMVNLKWNRLPAVHIVDRYFKAVKSLEIVNDKDGLDWFFPPDISMELPEGPFICLVIGAAHNTKQIPVQKAVEICEQSPVKVVLIGGNAEKEKAGEIVSLSKTEIVNKAGLLTLQESAQYINNCELLISSDTGMMHIGAALNKPMIVVWGNTIPAFGMGPYYGQGHDHSTNIEVKRLSCRPCSKLGFSSCPRSHFRCMNDISTQTLISTINEMINRNS